MIFPFHNFTIYRQKPHSDIQFTGYETSLLAPVRNFLMIARKYFDIVEVRLECKFFLYCSHHTKQSYA